jgi:hypothetical protein
MGGGYGHLCPGTRVDTCSVSGGDSKYGVVDPVEVVLSCPALAGSVG